MIKISDKITDENDCRILYKPSEKHKEKIPLTNAIDTFLRHYDIILTDPKDNDKNELIRKYEIEVFNIEEDYSDYVVIKGIDARKIEIKNKVLLQPEDKTQKKAGYITEGNADFNKISIFDHRKYLEFIEYKIIYQE